MSILSPGFGVTLWNDIPRHIRDLPCQTFKAILRRHLSDILVKK